jgi:hypothetical protein
MSWQQELLNRLAAAVPCGYELSGPAASEPTCLAAMVLSHGGEPAKSRQALQWIRSIQADDGSIGPTEALTTPGWPTALAVLAEVYAAGSETADVLGLRGKAKQPARIEPTDGGIDVELAVEWLLEAKGNAFARNKTMGHDTTLVGWPWVIGTHSWIEPTALAVLALKAAGRGDHPRTREGVRLLRDRLLPGGGCNYGNTTVLGQLLRPHIQPTGLALLALHGETDDDGRIGRSVEWLAAENHGQIGVASLAYGVWALARYRRALPDANGWLAGAANRRTTQNSPYRAALLLLAQAALAGQTFASAKQRAQNRGNHIPSNLHLSG